MNPNQRMMMRIMGPYAFFATIFSFILPPIGFLMAYSGYRKDKAANERYGGWIFLLAISVLSSVMIIVLIIVLATQSGN